MSETRQDRSLTEAAQREVRAAVHRIVAASDPTGFAVEPTFPRASITAHVPAPVPALAAALALWRVARGETRRQLRRVRETGGSWADLAVMLRPVLDLPDDAPAYERAAAAFEWAAGPRRGLLDDRYVVWRCPACGGLVTDHGPDAGPPADREPGHARGCTRLADDVDAWRRDDPGMGRRCLMPPTDTLVGLANHPLPGWAAALGLVAAGLLVAPAVHRRRGVRPSRARAGSRPG